VKLSTRDTPATSAATATLSVKINGKITWNPFYGAKIIWADGHGPGTTPTTTPTTTTTQPTTTIPPTTTTPPTTTAPPTTTPPSGALGNPIVAVLTLFSNLLGSLGGR
jgi:polysaccharide biosynthesis protein PslG